ncbi:MAG TPA: ATP-binding protein, partial [Methylocystis sp.]|nr:ATP-binding protein [Methylocystis sp.]
MTAADQAKDLPHADWLALLLDRETSWRRDKRLTTRLRAAKLRQQASVEDVDYRAARGLDRALFQKLADGEWIDAHYYSVPYRFARAEVEARVTARGVEIFHKGERIAVHIRASGNR